MSFANSSNSLGGHRPAKFFMRSCGAVALFSLLNLQAAFAALPPVTLPNPDLPGATANLVNIPTGSLIIPMDNALQSQGLTAVVGFNLKAYGLANKMLQNNVPMSWAIRSDKPKIRGIITTAQATCSPLTSTSSSFLVGGVTVGDLVTNVTDGMTRGRVTAVTANTLTLTSLETVAADLDCALNDEFVVDGHDFTVTAARLRPTAIAAASVSFAGGPFIISNAVPQFVTKALTVAASFTANASESNVTMYQTTAAVQVDIRYALQHKPFVAISDFNTVIHSSIMVAAGIPGSNTCSPLPGQPGFDANACNWNQVNPLLLATLECATVHLEPHRNGQAATVPPAANNAAAVAQVVNAVNAFVAGGGNFVAQCHAVQYFENANLAVPPNVLAGKFMTSLGAADNGVDGVQQYPNPPMAYNQITGPLDGTQGGSIPRWTLNGGTYNKNNGYINTQDIAPNTTTHRAAAAKVPTPNGVGGNVMYLGGHTYANNTLQQINGRRMLLNALFIPPDRPFQCGLSINAALIIVKKVVNDNGGAATVDDFNLDTDATANPLIFDAGVTVGDETTYTAETLNVIAGQTFTLTEDPLAGYTEGTWSCVSSLGGPPESNGPAGSGSVDLPDPGVTKTCTITNDDAASVSILIDKQGSLDVGGDGVASVGDLISYTFDVTNTGNVTLTSVDVTDPLTGLSAIDCNGVTAGLGNPIPSLAPAATVQCTATYAITQADINAGLRDNTATAEGECTAGAQVCPTTDDDPNSVPIPQVPGIEIIKTGVLDLGGDSVASVGDTINYTFDVTNTGNVTLTSVDVTDPLTGLSAIDCNGVTAGLGNPIPSLAPAATVQCTATYAITQVDINAGARDNTATAEGECTVVDNDPVVCPATDDDPETVPIPTNAKVNLAKSVITSFENPKGTFNVDYRVTATNTGNAAGSYNLVDTFTPGTGVTLTYVELTSYDAGSESNQSGTVAPPGTLPYDFTSDALTGATLVTAEGLAAGKNESWVISASFVVDTEVADLDSLDCDGYVDPAVFTGTANGITGSATDEEDADDRACAPLPQINLAKTVKSINEDPSGTFTVEYTVTATNNGDGDGAYDLVDTFLQGTGITLLSAKLTSYDAGSENGQSGTLLDPPIPFSFTSGDTLVEDEGLDAGLDESWTITAVFKVDQAVADVDALGCEDLSNPAVKTGTLNQVTGSSTDLDLTDNRACEPLPQINLAKNVVSSTSTGINTWRVVYQVTATNNGKGDGIYDLTDTFSPGNGLAFDTAELSYDGGTDAGTNGTPAGPLPYTFTTSPKTLVTDEGLAVGKNESWTITADFTITPGETDGTSECSAGRGTPGTGLYNAIAGSGTDLDDTDNHDCATPDLAGPTQFRVTKHFTDGNPMDVEVKINCFTGLPLTQTQEISENRDVVFIVESFDPGTLDCDIDEVVPEGYSPSYSASSDAAADFPGVAGDITDDAAGCHFEDVDSGAFVCAIVNTPDPVDLVIEKKWIIEGTGGDQVNQNFGLTLYCDTYIVGEQTSNDCYDPRLPLTVKVPSEPIACSLDLYGTGDKTFTVEVVPEWPDSHCHVDEHIYDDAVEVDNGCKNLVVSAGHGDSCLITNTVFFEGIPTLNQYGMMLLALLMLGVGMVGFRRFV